MTPSLELLDALQQLGTRPFTGTVFRHNAPRYDPLKGEGARLLGGRWNVRDGASTIYLAKPHEACIAELQRLVTDQARGLASFPRTLHTIAADALDLVDLTHPDALAAVGLTGEHISSDDRSACQAVGDAVHYMGFQGVFAPSATGVGFVLAVFELKLRPGQLRVISTDVLPAPPAH